MTELNGTRARTRAARALVLPVAAAAALVLTPGSASAAPPDAATVTPVLDCVSAGEDGSFDAVVGYTNPTGRRTDVGHGPDNRITHLPGPRPQPTTFEPGTVHGAFVLHVDGDAPAPSWTLAGTQLSISRSAAGSCSPALLPTAMGSAPGPVLLLLGTALLGSGLRRLSRWGTPPRRVAPTA